VSGANQKLHVVLVGLALAVTTVGAYSYLAKCEFTNYDDPHYVTDNSFVNTGLSYENAKWAFTSGYRSNWHPLTWLSHMLDCHFFGLNPAAHHLHNLLLHILSACLLFLFFYKATGSMWSSAFVAAGFALHPLHVESVAWVSERKDVLSTFFWMLTMLAYLRYVRGRRVGWYVVTLAVFALGLMAKPMLVTLPFVLLLIDYWPLGRFEVGSTKSRPVASSLAARRKVVYLIVEKVPMLVLVAASSVVTFLVQRGGGAVASTRNLTLGMRIENAVVSYVAYIWDTIWPSRLAAFYPHPLDTLSILQIATSAGLLLGVSAVVVLAAKRHKYLPVGWFWYLGTLVPVIGLVQVGNQARADRYTYIPLIGIFIIAAWGATELAGRVKRSRVLLSSVGLAVMLGWAMMTHLQVRYWRDSGTLFERAIAVTAKNHVAHTHLAHYLRDEGRLAEAIKQFQLALKIRAANPDALNGLGLTLLRLDKPDEAVTWLTRALEINPAFGDALVNLAVATAQTGDSERAAAYLRKSLAIDPRSYRAHANMGILLGRMSNTEEAVEHLEAAIRLNPNEHTSYYNLGQIRLNQGDLNRAAECFSKAVEVKGDYAQAYDKLGQVMARQGDIDRAVEYYNRTIEIDPKFTEAYCNLAASLLEMGNTERAIAVLSKAANIDPNSVNAHLYLGLTLAQEDRFVEATAQFRRVVELNPQMAAARVHLGVALRSQGMLDEAIAELSEAVKLDPNLPVAHIQLGNTLLEKGRLAEALEHYEKARALADDDANVLNKMAWVLAVYPDTEFHDPQAAVKLAARAVELTAERNAQALATLAAAYATGGDFDRAVAAAEKALELARLSNRAELAEDITGQLELYRNKQPYVAGNETPAQ